MLEMRENCEKCGVLTPKTGEACICSFECTFCVPCSDDMDRTCPNCGGELKSRPKRALDV